MAQQQTRGLRKARLQPDGSGIDEKPSRTRTVVFASGLATMICVILFCLGWTQGFLAEDALVAFLPRHEWAARSALALRMPLWNPFEYCGEPLLGSAQGSMLYPPIVVAYAVLPPVFAIQAVSGFHVLLFCLGAMFLLRDMGAGLAAGALAGVLAVASVLGGIGFGYPNIFGAASWFPVTLFCLRRAIAGNTRWTGALGLAYGGMWLAGYPDFPMDAGVLLMLFATLDVQGALARRLGIVSIGLALGLGIAAVQVLAVQEMALESVREGVATTSASALAQWRSGWSVTGILDLFDKWVGRFGPASFVLAALAIRRGTRAALPWLATFCWCTFALNFPFVLLYRLPGFSSVRVPLAWADLSTTILACLAGVGLADLGRGSPRVRALGRLLAVAAVAHSAWRVEARMREYPSPRIDRFASDRRAEIMGDLVTKLDPDARILSDGERRAGGLLRHGLRAVNGWEPARLEPARVDALLTAAGITARMDGSFAWNDVRSRARLGSLLGLGFVVVARESSAPFEQAGFRMVGTLPGGDVVLHQAPRPRARLAHRVIEVASRKESLRATIEEARRDDPAVVIEGPADLVMPSDVARATSEETARLVEDLPERVTVQVSAAIPGILVLVDTFAPGWRVSVDGTEAPLLLADHAFRGVRVDAGQHHVTFDYRPRSLVVGGPVSLLSLCMALVILLRSCVLPSRTHAMTGLRGS